MGNCYSKNSSKAGTGMKNKDLQNKRASQDHLKKNGTREMEEMLLEKQPLEEDEKSSDETSMFETINATHCTKLGPSMSDSVPGHFIVKNIDSIVPYYDSGQNNIVNVQENICGISDTKPEKDELSKKLERLSRGSCHKCGNFKLDDFTLSALLADTYCSCGPKQVGKPTVNPRCQTHGAERNGKNISSTFNANQGFVTENGKTNVSSLVRNGFGHDVDHSAPKSAPRILNLTDKGACIQNNISMTNSCASSKDNIKTPCSGTFNEENSTNKAPLAQFDSMETNLNNSSISLTKKRRSLLGDLLDITENICKCDFYCTNLNGEVKENEHSCIIQGQSHEAIKNCVRNYPIRSPISNKKEHLIGWSADSSQKSISPSKKDSSLPKNVSFADCDGAGTETSLCSLNSPPKKCLQKLGELRDNMSDSPFRLYNDEKTSSDLFLAKKYKDVHKRAASVGSARAVMSDSSSDAPCCINEDDIRSLDLDNISRMTSLSLSSIRQLLDSTEDLVQQANAVQHVTIDGVDCMVIPKETYDQMQVDLSVLKQQLLCLSLLMRKGNEDIEQMPDF